MLPFFVSDSNSARSAGTSIVTAVPVSAFRYESSG